MEAATSPHCAQCASRPIHQNAPRKKAVSKTVPFLKFQWRITAATYAVQLRRSGFRNVKFGLLGDGSWAITSAEKP